MTALSPAELAEVTRFGIHDTDIIHHMETHLDDTIVCHVNPCGKEAAWRLAMRCCDAAIILCHPHHAKTIRRMIWKLDRDTTATCLTCGHEFARRTPLADIIRVVPL